MPAHNYVRDVAFNSLTSVLDLRGAQNLNFL
jgi:hypothetical protein